MCCVYYIINYYTLYKNTKYNFALFVTYSEKKEEKKYLHKNYITHCPLVGLRRYHYFYSKKRFQFVWFLYIWVGIEPSL